jgi:hypothetical protein
VDVASVPGVPKPLGCSRCPSRMTFLRAVRTAPRRKPTAPPHAS